MITFPNAKINLGLNIIRKRNDGYHDIESVFYPVPLTDSLEIFESKKNEFITLGNTPIPDDGKKNLCERAYDFLQRDFDLPPVKIVLLKNIPVGAGLGGGSADASFTLTLVNELFKLDISVPELQKYAELIGSDCSFFIQNKPAWVTSKGEIHETIKLHLEEYDLEIVYPGIHVSTAEAYNGVTPCLPIKPILTFIDDIDSWKNNLINDFEAPIAAKYPLISEIKKQMYANGAIYASMTGSGSALFALYKKKSTYSWPSHFTTFYLCRK